MSDGETSPDYLARAEEIARETRLSLRQAEVYVLHVEERLSIRAAADWMEISDGNASEKWHTVKQKVRDARKDKTADLPIEPETTAKGGSTD